jgi:protein TonB
MKSNLLISSLIAVAIHTILFILPLHRVGSSTASLVKPPMSLTIVSTELPVPAAPAVLVPAKTSEKPLPPPKKKATVKEVLHPEEEIIRKKRPVTIPVAGPVFSQTDISQDGTEPSEDGIAVGTAPARGESSADLQEHVAVLGHQQGEDVIVYARPRYKENPLPHYPRVARRRGYEGQALLHVQVLKSGRVGRIEMATSSGFEVLDSAALKSVKSWVFVPGTKNGVKIDQWVMVPVRFSLK